MLKSIKSRLILGVIFLIFVIQALSFVFNFKQTQNLLISELTFGAENQTRPMIKSLFDQIENHGDIDQSSNIKDLFDATEWSIKVLTLRKFPSIVESDDKLKSIQFIDSNGTAIGHSEKSKFGKKADPELSDLMRGQIESYVQKDGLFFVFIPFSYKETFLGGFVLAYANDRMYKEQRRIILFSVGSLVFFILLTSITLPIFVSRVLTKPIKQLKNLMREYAVGRLDNRPTYTENDEISEIGKELNTLIENIHLAFNYIDDVMSKAEAGDLTQGISSELPGDFNNIRNKTNKTILMLDNSLQSVAHTGRQVNYSAGELSNAASSLSDSTTTQASTMEQIASSMEEIGSKTESNMIHSTKTRELSSKTLELVNTGDQQMTELLAAMEEINTTSSDVSKIIKVIDEIAFQTNLLALNAAVEAARAGTHGKGFAVVAEEVRTLAARSAVAAKETTKLIDKAVMKVKGGVLNVKDMADILDKIVSSVQTANEYVAEIETGSKEQNLAIIEINDGLSQVNQTIQKNSAISEETASSADILLNQSVELNNIIERFILSETLPIKTDEESQLISGLRTFTNSQPKNDVFPDEEFNIIPSFQN